MSDTVERTLMAVAAIWAATCLLTGVIELAARAKRRWWPMTVTYACCVHCGFDCIGRTQGHDIPCPDRHCQITHHKETP